MILYEWRHVPAGTWKDNNLQTFGVWQVEKNVNGDKYLIATFATEEDARAMMKCLGRAIECQSGS